MRNRFVAAALAASAWLFGACGSGTEDSGSGIAVSLSVPGSSVSARVATAEFGYELSAVPTDGASVTVRRSGSIAGGSSEEIVIDDVEAGGTYRLSLVLTRGGVTVAEGSSEPVTVLPGRVAAARIKMGWKDGASSSGPLFTVPEAGRAVSAGDFEGLSSAVADAAVGSAVTKITLTADISLTSGIEYHNENVTSSSADIPLIIDLDGHTLTSSVTYGGAAITSTTSLYVLGGTVQGGSEGKLFHNKSKLYLKDVAVVGAGASSGHAVCQENNSELFMSGGSVKMFSGSVVPLKLSGFSVISGAEISGTSGGCSNVIDNDGALFLTGGASVSMDGATTGTTGGAISNIGSTILVGATVNGGISNGGTLGLFDSFERNGLSLSADGRWNYIYVQPVNPCAICNRSFDGSATRDGKIIFGRSTRISSNGHVLNYMPGSIFAADTDFRDAPTGDSVIKIKAGEGANISSLAANFGSAADANSLSASNELPALHAIEGGLLAHFAFYAD